VIQEKKKPHTDDYQELQEAIAVINKYSATKAPLQGTSAALKHFKETIRQIGSLFLRKLFKKQPIPVKLEECELTKALETIKNHYLLIKKLKRGNEKEKKLAKQALETIQSYNEYLEAKSPSPRWSDKITRFLSKNSLTIPPSFESEKLQFPFTATTNVSNKRHTVDKLQHAFSKVACSIETRTKTNRKRKITIQEMDLFRMKAITLLRDHKLKVKRESVQKAPIILLSEDQDKGIVSLFQTITPFPGETIELKGKFKRNPEHDDRPIPMSDSFHLTTSSTQTGFPHPSQHHGWSLAVQLIPVCPHRLDVMTHFSNLQERRKEIANTLLPMGSHNRHAKELLKLKKEAFDTQKEELITLHQTLSETIVKRSLCENCPTDAITHYFDLLITLPYAYDYLSETNAIINEKFIKIPYNQLQEERLSTPIPFKNRDHTQHFLIEKIQQQEEKLKNDFERANSDFEKFTLEYILLMGKAITHGTVPIILQELSENLSFAPPLLDEFSRELQHSAYKQLIDFLDELDAELSTTKHMHLYTKHLILEDIALFQGKPFDEGEKITPILNELEAYYNQRYYSRQSN
jgi:hypothetical protein